MIVLSRIYVVTTVACAAILIAGCTGPAQRASPGLTLLGEGDCPWGVDVRLTNNDAGSITASYSGFKMVDANGTVGPVDAAATVSMAPSNFPSSVALARGESAEGIIIFSSRADNGPYTLKYDSGGVSAQVRLNTPPPGTDGCTGSNPNTNNPSLVLQAQIWNSGNLLVNIQSSSGATVNPTDLTYILQDRNGTTYYTGVAGLNTLTSGTNVNVVYQDNIDASKAGAGDSLKITVTPSSSIAIQGGRLRIFYQSNEIGAIALP